MIITKGNYSFNRTSEKTPTDRRVSYPIVISEDTTFIEANFSQPNPHTEIFQVADGVKLIFENCNLINVTVPDGAEIIRSNNAQVIRTATGSQEKPFTNLLHDCDKCSSFVKELRAVIANGEYEGKLHEIKELARERRKDSKKVEKDIADIKAENQAALAKYNGNS